MAGANQRLEWKGKGLYQRKNLGGKKKIGKEPSLGQNVRGMPSLKGKGVHDSWEGVTPTQRQVNRKILLFVRSGWNRHK